MLKFSRPLGGPIQASSFPLSFRRAIVGAVAGTLVVGGAAVIVASPAQAAAPNCFGGSAPISGSAGTTISVVGSGLNSGTKIELKMTKASQADVVISGAGMSGMVEFTLPSGMASGSWTRTFDNGDGTCSLGLFNVTTVPPTVSAVSPAGGPLAGGTTITLTGTNFSGTPTVRVGGTLATAVTVVSSTSVTAVTPAGTGTQDVSITTSDGTGTRASAFTYAAVPTITSVVANGIAAAGPTAGGTSFTVIGTNLTGTSAITVGGGPATSVSVVNSTQVNAVSPAGLAGARDVVLTTPGGSVTATGGFTYFAVPTLTSISPSTGSTAGGDMITLTGANLAGTTGVSVGGTAATSVTVLSSTSVTAVTPAGSAGAADVAITTPGGTATTVGGFTFAAPAPPPGPAPAPAPEPSVSATPTPTATPSATPTPTVSASPTAVPELAPVTPPAGELPPGKGLVLEGGKAVQVNTAPLPNNSGVKVGGSDWDVSLQTGSVAVTGDPADPVVSLRLSQGGVLESKGSGYLPNSQVEVYAFSNPTLLGIVTTDANGDFDGTVTVPKAFQLGGHTLQINAFTKTGKVRSVSLGVVVVSPDGKSASAPVYFNKFAAKQGAAGNRTLKTLLGTVPAGSKPVATIFADVRPQATAADKVLALKRATSVSAYLKSQGFAGRIKVKLKTIATFGTWKDRRVDSTIVFNHS